MRVLDSKKQVLYAQSGLEGGRRKNECDGRRSCWRQARAATMTKVGSVQFNENLPESFLHA